MSSFGRLLRIASDICTLAITEYKARCTSLPIPVSDSYLSTATSPYTLTMVRTIGLLGVSGLLGSHLLAALAAAHEKGTLQLVALARPSSDTSKVPAGVEKRVLDADTASLEEVQRALEGIDVLM